MDEEEDNVVQCRECELRGIVTWVEQLPGKSSLCKESWDKWYKRYVTDKIGMVQK